MTHFSSVTFFFLLCNYQTLSQNEPVKEEIVNSMTQMAIKLNKLFYQSSEIENVIFSPINIYSALALLHLASNNESRKEISTLLGFPKDENQYQKAHETLSQILNSVERTTILPALENCRIRTEKRTQIFRFDRIFINKGVNLKPSYISQALSLYKGKVAVLDFANAGSKTTDAINKYISNRVKGRMLFECLTPDTQILLLSFLHFEAAWDKTFPEYATQDATFYTDSQNLNVKMMSNTDDVFYINLPSLKAEAINLKYAGDDVSMVILLPDADQQLDNLILSLNPDIVKEISQNSKLSYVNYAIPKVKYKWSDTIAKHLEKLGVQNIFSNLTDLSNMIMNATMKVSEITHIADIEINEKGTDVESAETVSKCVVVESCEKYPVPIYFTVNRPFVFYILDRVTNAILFLGSIKNPNPN